MQRRHRKMGNIGAKEQGRIHIVSLPWRGQDKYWWNEACADVLEVFGLPGDRYTSHPTMDQMDFHFKSKKDADLCQILLSEKI
jgi:hypothetical protein